MGREWLSWVSGGGGGRRSTGRGRTSAETREAQEGTSPGCMCAVFQLFDLHPFQFPLNQQHPASFLPDSHFLQEEGCSSEGVEAPRNSLELEEAAGMRVASMEEENLNFPEGLQIKTRVSKRASKSRTDQDFSSECSSSSPGTKTPNLVARLMGLDVLPQCSSPSFSSSNSGPQTKSHFNPYHGGRDGSILERRSSGCLSDDDIGVGARSLPETPRISLARRSDVECHRLSLGVNKENINDEFRVESRRGRFSQHPQDENRSPGHYAKQMVKQVKERVSRRVGLDITNISRDQEETRKDENLILLKPTKNYSKVKFLDTSNGKPVGDSGTKRPRISGSSHGQQPQGILGPPKTNHLATMQEHKYSRRNGSGNACSRMKKFSSDHAIRNKKAEPFVRPATANRANLTGKKTKRAPLSSELLNTSGPPILLPVKKDPSPPATKLPQKQTDALHALSSKRNTQSCRSTSRSYEQLHQRPDDKTLSVPEKVQPDSTNRRAITAPAGYKDYVQRILKRTGIADEVTPWNLGKWHAPSHPLDPSIFYYLELFHPAAASAAVLTRRCDRKLIFQLVDELLADMLRPKLDFWPWASGVTDHLGLTDELCKRMESFPAASCRVLEDIDSLIEKDLSERRLNGFSEEERERLVCEIEGEIMGTLLHETVEAVHVRTEE